MNDLTALEAAVWRAGADEAAIAAYRAALPERARHDFVVVIPVADRPEHLAAVLESLWAHRARFAYPREVQVLIVDDSATPESVAGNKRLAAAYRERGLATEYFGADAQRARLAALTDRASLARVLGPGADHPHKGASVSRNLAYLRLAELAAPDRLFFFVDSDELFRVRVPDVGRGRDVDGFSYFHTLDRIFAGGDVDLLTGKVVGDPPVSPAVMAGNFLDDVRRFLTELATHAPDSPCGFHGAETRQAADAAYHDMADLFGFTLAEAFAYRCALGGAHEHRACLADFAARLDRFFDGEHPTRLNHFEYAGPLHATVPARTVYTGNYVLHARALRHFIPFATLKLRMAGPVLGRLVKARLGGRFVSANLPLLHTRTTAGSGRAEFRPGVDRDAARVDLGGEFERQFWGDVMLFTVERLIALGYPEAAPASAQVAATLDTVIAEFEARYRDKREATMQRLASAEAAFAALAPGWCDAATRARFEAFFANVADNFGADSGGERRIADPDRRARRRAAMLDGLLAYPDDRRAWDRVMTAMGVVA